MNKMIESIISLINTDVIIFGIILVLICLMCLTIYIIYRLTINNKINYFIKKISAENKEIKEKTIEENENTKGLENEKIDNEIILEINDIIKNNKYVDANELINYRYFISSSIEKIYRVLLNSLTALGLLGTFIGLNEAISKINFNFEGDASEKIFTAILSVINSMKGAFLTSILGVILSILFSLILGLLISLSKYYTDKIVNNLKKQYKNLDSKYFYNEYIKNSSQFLITGIEKIVNNFTKQMKENLLKEIEDYKKSIKTSTDDINKVDKNIVEVNKQLIQNIADYQAKLKEIKTETGKYEGLTKEFNTTLTSLKTNFDNLIASYNNLEKSNKEYQEKIINLNTEGLNNLESKHKDLQLIFTNIQQLFLDFNKETLNAIDSLDPIIKENVKNIFKETIRTSYNELEKTLIETIKNNQLNNDLKVGE